jgi:hypothetical protein
MHQNVPGKLFLAVVLAGAVGCAGEANDPGGSAGSPGSAGTGGSAPVAGSGGRGGSPGTVGSGGSGGSAGSAGTGGGAGGGSAGGAGSGGSGGGAGSGGRPADARPVDRARDTGGAMPTTDAGSPSPGNTAPFSFFYTSLEAMRRLSGSQNGFGGNLTFGTPSGLEGADKICQTIAEGEGFGSKTWRAFLSVVQGPGGQPAHAIDRIGEGPWYDRNGRVIAMNKAGLLAGNRPMGNAQAVSDLPDEKGRGTRPLGDTHDVITGSNRMGRLASMNRANTCQDWTSAMGTGSIQLGHSWPSPQSGPHWITVHTARNCAAGVNLMQNGPGNGQSIGSGGGWGGIYCFALTP